MPEDDVYLILVDRLWPRGITKDRARVDLWLKDIAPSDRLRKWFGHNPARWDKFKDRYFAELRTKADLVQVILDKSMNVPVCLLYGAKDEEYNNAVALKEFLDSRLDQADSVMKVRT